MQVGPGFTSGSLQVYFLLNLAVSLIAFCIGSAFLERNECQRLLPQHLRVPKDTEEDICLSSEARDRRSHLSWILHAGLQTWQQLSTIFSI